MSIRKIRKAIKKRMVSLIMCAEMRIRRKRAEVLRYGEYKLVKPNIKYKDIHKGKRCFIIGNGPSLKKVDLASLKDEITFTVNESPRIADFPKLHTNYHVWTDENFFNADFSTPEGKELMDVMKSVNTPDNHPVVFYKTSARKMIKKYHLDKELNISYIMEGFSLRDPNLDLPIDRPISRFDTCVQYMIVAAVYMGFSEIYLLGCDCTMILTDIYARINAGADKMEYAYDCSSTTVKRIKDEYKNPIDVDLMWFSHIFGAYRLLDQYCKKRGVRLCNATQGSLLVDLEMVKLEDVLKKKY